MLMQQQYNVGLKNKVVFLVSVWVLDYNAEEPRQCKCNAKRWTEMSEERS